jgi:molybdopterin molybdotransferase
LGQNACIEIMTGAVVPRHADCIVPYEATTRIDTTGMQLLDPSAHAAGHCIHPLASDRPAGAVLLEVGTLIGSREIAVIASCGYDQLQVCQIPAIAIVSTGDELVAVQQQPAAHQIRRSNDIAIETALARHQLHARDHAHLPDSPDSSRAQLEALIQNNRIVIISGGISMGKKDYIPAALQQLGLTCHFHGVAQKPGKPFGYWSRPDCAVFTLPGNPLSTLICLHHYVVPAIFAAMGQRTPSQPHAVTLTQPVQARDDMTLFLPVQLTPQQQAEPRPAQNSGDLVRILASDGYIELPPRPSKTYATDTRFNFHPWY